MNGMYVALTICLGVLLLFQRGAAIRCSVCDTEVTGWDCLTKSPPAQDCPGFDYCINVAYYSETGKIRSYTRSCSPFQLPDACIPGINKSTGESIQACYSTCSLDGCNGDRSLHHLIDLLRRRRRK